MVYQNRVYAGSAMTDSYGIVTAPYYLNVVQVGEEGGLSLSYRMEVKYCPKGTGTLSTAYEQQDLSLIHISSSTVEEKVAVWRNSGLGETFQWNGAWTNEGYVFVTTTNARKTNGTLCCVDKATGKAVQKIELGESVRSDVSYYNGRIYFTTQSGNLYSYNLTKEGILDTENLIEPLYFGGASTSTPAVYNNRVYIGYSGGESFGAEGYGILVGSIDPDTGAMSAAYVVPTDGYPQTSGLITRGYEEETGYVYVYFLTNSAHGTLYMIKDKAGMTEADPASGVFYTPNHEQYCIASAVADSDGNIYMKNDSAWQFVITRSETYLKEIQATGGNAAVSYTHLDVYKRQPASRP